MKNFLPSILLSFFLIPSAKSQTAGTIDSTFGVNGIAAGTLIPDFFQFGDVLIQPDGKMVVMGRMKNGNDYDVVMMRVDSNGTLDNSFGTNGEEEIITPFVSELPAAAALQDDGKILVGGGAGQTAFVGRFNTDGTLDNSFGTNGWTYTAAPGANYGDVWGLHVLPNGKILAGGNALGSADVFRLKENGKVDSTFGTNGHAIVPGMTVFCATVLSNGKILVGGRLSHCCIAQLTADGKIDSSFGTNGIVETNVNNQLSWFIKILPLADGKIIGAGAAYTDNLLQIQYTTARYDSNGVIDNSYASNGYNVTSFTNYFITVPTGAALQSDGRVIFVGEVAVNNGDFSSFMLLQMTADGEIDSGFGDNGVAITGFGASNYGYPFAVALQSDSKIIVGGRIDNDGSFVMAAVRYLSGFNTGIPAFTAKENELMACPNPLSDRATLSYSLQRDEKISIRLLDPQGRIVQSLLSDENQSSGEHRVDITLDERLVPGIYFIAITNGSVTKSIRVIRE